MPDHFDHQGFCDSVDHYLATKRISIRSAADHMGLSMSSLMRYLRGEGGISLNTAAGLAKFCELSLDRYVLR